MLSHWRKVADIKKYIRILEWSKNQIIFSLVLLYLGPNWFCTDQIILDGYNLFWTGPNHFGLVQIIKISPEKSNLSLSKMISTRPKQFVTKSTWTSRRTWHLWFPHLFCEMNLKLNHLKQKTRLFKSLPALRRTKIFELGAVP